MHIILMFFQVNHFKQFFNQWKQNKIRKAAVLVTDASSSSSTQRESCAVDARPSTLLLQSSSAAVHEDDTGSFAQIIGILYPLIH